MSKNIKQEIFNLLEADETKSLPRRLTNIFLMTLIILSAVFVIGSTVKDLSPLYYQYLDIFRTFSFIVFSMEYVLRIWVCTLHKKYHQPITGRIRYIFTPLAIVDLVAILPFYFSMFLPDLLFIRIIRVLSLIKFARYSASLKTLGKVLVKIKDDIAVISIIMVSILIITSSLVYYVEHEAQPEAFSSIPASMWWAIITMTTVGYGDIYPVTPLGKILGSIIALVGVGILALPTAVLAAAFTEELKLARKKKPDICKHCGKEIT